MTYISAEEWELLSFFEKEPQRAHLDTVWVYDVRVLNEKSTEILEIIVNPSETIRMKVKPHITLSHHIQAALS